jgi:hypothetical protein
VLSQKIWALYSGIGLKSAPECVLGVMARNLRSNLAYLCDDVREGFVAAVATPDQLPSREYLIFRDLGTFDDLVQPIERNDICGH